MQSQQIFTMDFIQIFGDYFKLMGMTMLLLKIITTQNAAGISFKTQLLYCLISVTRYLDLMYGSIYVKSMKIVFICLPVLTTLLMLRYKKTYDAQYDRFRIIHLIVPCALASMVLERSTDSTEKAWLFSQMLESVAMLPQIYLVTKKNQVESIIVAYICSLGLYRGFYLLHWGYQQFYHIQNADIRYSLAAALVQIFFYLDFFAKNLPEYKSKYADKYNGATSTLLAEGQAKDFNQHQIVIPNVCGLVERKDAAAMMADATSKTEKSKQANALESVVFTTPIARDAKDNSLTIKEENDINGTTK